MNHRPLEDRGSLWWARHPVLARSLVLFVLAGTCLVGWYLWWLMFTWLVHLAMWS
jgi:hypothetical protein